MSWTLTSNYSLKKIDYDTEQNTWGDILNENWDNIDLTFPNIMPPIGSILAWHKNLTGVPVLSGNWLECNGQTVVDSASPLNGEVLPDLNGETRFLRGSSTSGNNENHQMQSHQHDDAGHSHTFAEYTGNLGIILGSTIRRVGDPYSTTSPTGVSAAVLGDPTDSGTGAGIPSHGNETRPVNMSVVWIIRIK